MSSEDLDWVQQYVTLLQQWERVAGAASGSVERDRAMADNLLWVADKNPSARIFAWAHNAHVSRKVNAMGWHVDQRIGAQYRIFGFTFGLGFFNAVSVNSGGTTSTLQQQTIAAIDSTSVEALFSATQQPRLIFDTRKITSGGTLASSFRTVRMRSIGALYSTSQAAAYFERTLLPADYDALIWFAGTSKSTLLPFQ